ncbi:hypothetical protein Q3G72_029948 [Acer saccharum]|nr:hypothetical protein Q3G72_029948 [Acer saccharum]
MPPFPIALASVPVPSLVVGHSASNTGTLLLGPTSLGWEPNKSCWWVRGQRRAGLCGVVPVILCPMGGNVGLKPQGIWLVLGRSQPHIIVLQSGKFKRVKFL